jgi:NAD-reducing hydrogenase large subunit
MAFDAGNRRFATLGYHWARMIEMLHAAEAIKELLHDDDLQGTIWWSPANARKSASA